ncbi:hypothetical protein [Pseudomonas syringae]
MPVIGDQGGGHSITGDMLLSQEVAACLENIRCVPPCNSVISRSPL